MSQYEERPDLALSVLNDNSIEQLRQYMHEFQQPLTVIVVLAELAHYRDLPETTRNDFQIILEAADELHQVLIKMQQIIT